MVCVEKLRRIITAGGEDKAPKGGELGGDVMDGEAGEKGSETNEGIEEDKGVEGEERELFEVTGVAVMATESGVRGSRFECSASGPRSVLSASLL